MSHRTHLRVVRFPAQQRGATLIVGLVMLVLLALHALASFTSGSTQLRIIGNMHERQAAQAAANAAIGIVLSTSDFVTQPAGVAATPVDVDTGGSNYRVSVTPTCSAALSLGAGKLDPESADDLQCIAGAAFGGASLCATSYWNLRAVTAPAAGAPATGVTTEINQGAAVRLEVGEARMSC
ncbi:MAG: PilX N-terminal domain-containing pilus assembly protein [Betaproteobacteria bacterium]